MLKRSAVRSAAQAIAQERFDSILQPICKGKIRLGLAISGGVDSMALASLCSKVQGFNMPPVTAFIVDHCLRYGSAAEAISVASNLQRLGIASEILKMEWPNHRDPVKLPNLETAARKLRFQLLGRACAKSQIDTLLLAHHGDDQAETILSRVYAGYLGTGLQGIQAISPIPECHGAHGVSESGITRRLDPSGTITKVFVESGGVTIHRPLLDFTKAELIATCHARQVSWHEDATNADKTLTARNAIRHLIGSGALPHALSTVRLRELAANKLSHRQSCNDTATAMFKACKVELNTRTSSVSFSIHPKIEDWLRDTTNPPLAAALLTRKFLSLSEDKHKLQLQNIQRAVQYIFPFLFDHELSANAGVNVGNIVLLKTLESDKASSSGERRVSWKYSVLPRPVQDPERYTQVLLAEQETNARFALPAIVERSLVEQADESLSEIDTVWALPTIGWSRAGFSPWNFKTPGENVWQHTNTYKNIDFEVSDNHTVKSYTRPVDDSQEMRFKEPLDSSSPGTKRREHQNISTPDTWRQTQRLKEAHSRAIPASKKRNVKPYETWKHKMRMPKFDQPPGNPVYKKGA
ncbi:hypothetical protein D6C78_03650 [Aureobasidium pullulans]|uniref:tRNA(Ile)-lysidine synthetase n=1 Tax=Aureobasidium pullulans TaxID=5580 RepID=A0A4S9KLY1_AURPU|nr:hypothetical protein D6D00_08857 [Aureobasidium pullulans]TIA38916.1 hypothetical protein D6C78_03650 [Aureobasidium pullulans]